jgi:hypothetical protein
MSSIKSVSAYQTAAGAAHSEAGKGDADWNWRYRLALGKRDLELVSCREAPHGEHYPDGRALSAPVCIDGPRAWAMKSYITWKF